MSEHVGLYEGFEGFRNPTDDDLKDALRTALVVLDANVLLRLYDYQGRALDDFLQVLEALGDRLFVPHQSMDEFWRNRVTTLQQNQGKHGELRDIQRSFDTIEKSFAGWFKRVVDRSQAPPAEVLDPLAEARRRVLTFIEERHAASQIVRADTPTHEDHLLRRLEELLEGRVGSAPSAGETEELERVAGQRLATKTPPGYLDADKANGRGSGDYKVWRAAMDESGRRGLPLLLVTDDRKDDWWTGPLPRLELVQELKRETAQQLWMLGSHDLVRLGSAVGVDVSEQTIAQANESKAMVEGGDDGTWTVALAREYLDRLGESWPDHHELLEYALKGGGYLPREVLAERLGRDSSVNMSGVGKPYATAVRRLVQDGATSEPLPVPFYAVYDAGWMTHFTVPEELVPLFAEALSQTDGLDER